MTVDEWWGGFSFWSMKVHGVSIFDVGTITPRRSDTWCTERLRRRGMVYSERWKTGVRVGMVEVDLRPVSSRKKTLVVRVSSDCSGNVDGGGDDGDAVPPLPLRPV